MKKKAIVIGSGAGGAVAARELADTFEVLLLEAGKNFEPSVFDGSKVEWIRRSGLLIDPRMMKVSVPQMQVYKSEDMILCCAKAMGGTVNFSAGNALRYDKNLRELGIDLNQEFEELYSEIEVSTEHENRWSKGDKKLYQAFEKLGLQPQKTPKMIQFSKCRNCGQCILGCPYHAKWTVGDVLKEAQERGVKIWDKCQVQSLFIEENIVKQVVVKHRGRRKLLEADLIILAAGGFGTPKILERSGIVCKDSLYVDPMLCVAARYENAKQYKSLPMPFVTQQEHFMISPYFDWFSFFFHKDWRFSADHILSLMIKLKDEEKGNVNKKGKVSKSITSQDGKYFHEGVEMCQEIFSEIGIDKRKLFLGTANAGHPGGTMPLTKETSKSLHIKELPLNLYLADSTLFPKSMGNPPIFTIMALAKKVAKVCKKDI